MAGSMSMPGSTAIPVGQTNMGGQMQPAQQGQQPSTLKSALASNVTSNVMQNSGATQDISGIASGLGKAIGCMWIMTYGNGGFMPWFVKPLRDIAYYKEPDVQRGYERMANWLVPFMMMSCTIYGLVEELMVKPLTEHCGYITGIRGCKSRILYQKFWFGVWKITGRRNK